MNYQYTSLSKTTAIIELIPVTEVEKTLLKSLNKDNLDQDTLYHYYQEGLERNNISALLLSINSFIHFPNKAAISFEVLIGPGG